MKLHIACGHNVLDGWVNADIASCTPDTIWMDATQPFPYDDKSVDYILCEHFIEHLSETEAKAFLAECYRVLKPGGRIRLGTPDPSFVGSPGYFDTLNSFVIPNNWTAMGPVHTVDEWMAMYKHQVLYTEDALKDVLAQAGFVNLKRYPPRQSDDPELAGLEGHWKMHGDIAFDEQETMVIEGAKPGSV